MKKLITLFLVFSILLLSGNIFAKEKKGADSIIQKTDGQQVMGELIAVKENSLLLLERDSGADVTVDVEDVRVIKIGKKSEAVGGFIYGSLIMAGIGRLYLIHGNYKMESEWHYVRSILISGLIGAGIGAATGRDKTIQFEGKSDSEIQEILEKLRKKARVRNAQ